MFKSTTLTVIILSFLFLACSSSKGQSNDENMKVEKYADNPTYVISVMQGAEQLGEMVMITLPDVAPKHSHNFDSLVTIGFYNGTAFHRVIPGFMIQGGDPNSKDKPKNMWGFGDPSQTKVPAEFSDISHQRGIVSAARSQDPNSATSQFFICVDDASFLDKKYSVFGKVIEGMDVADKIVNLPRDKKDNPKEKVEMKITRVK